MEKLKEAFDAWLLETFDGRELSDSVKEKLWEGWLKAREVTIEETKEEESEPEQDLASDLEKKVKAYEDVKKMLEEMDKLRPPPIGSPPSDPWTVKDKPYGYSKTIQWPNQKCLVEEFFKTNPNGVCAISCPCPKCTPQFTTTTGEPAPGTATYGTTTNTTAPYKIQGSAHDYIVHAIEKSFDSASDQIASWIAELEG